MRFHLLIVFTNGGDRSLEYPNVAGLADVYGKESLSVIHFDSIYDAWSGGNHLIGHGYPVYRLINEGQVRAGLTEEHDLSPLSSEQAIDDEDPSEE